MSKYTQAEAEKKARQIHDRFAGLIHEACLGSVVPEDFLGGFVGVEAGVDKSGNIKPSATRFEPGVYHHLLAVRDGLLRSYNNIHRADIADASDEAIRSLSTSWGVTQIMGWHVIHNLKCTIEDLRDADKHFAYAVQLLTLTARHYLVTKDFGSVLRIWNSGSANGKTYDPNYVHNALSVQNAYSKILNSSLAKTGDVDDNRNAATNQTSPAIDTAADASTSVNDSVPSDSTPGNQTDQISEAQPPRSFWDRFKLWQSKADAANEQLTSVQNTVSPISNSSWGVVLWTKIMGWLTLAVTFYYQHQVSITVIGAVTGLALIGFALWYLTRAKDRTAAKAVPAQVQSQTVEVKP